MKPTSGFACENYAVDLGVHPYWKELERIRDSVRWEIFAYRAASMENPPIPIAQEGKTYRMGQFFLPSRIVVTICANPSPPS